MSIKETQPYIRAYCLIGVEMSNNTDNGYRSNIVYSMLDADKTVEFDTIVEILNKCFGKNYKGFQRAFVVLDSKGTAF